MKLRVLCSSVVALLLVCQATGFARAAGTDLKPSDSADLVVRVIGSAGDRLDFWVCYAKSPGHCVENLGGLTRPELVKLGEFLETREKGMFPSALAGILFGGLSGLGAGSVLGLSAGVLSGPAAPVVFLAVLGAGIVSGAVVGAKMMVDDAGRYNEDLLALARGFEPGVLHESPFTLKEISDLIREGIRFTHGL